MRGRQLTALQRSEQRDKHGHSWMRAGDVSDLLWWVDWRKVGLPYCTIYIIAPLDGWPCKIGISTCAMKRINSLQTSVWKQLEVKWCGWVPTVALARQLEQQSHKTLTEKSKWLHGEWFDLRPDKATELVMFEAELMGMPLSTTVPPGEALEYVKEEWLNTYGTAEAQKGLIERKYAYSGLFRS